MTREEIVWNAGAAGEVDVSEQRKVSAFRSVDFRWLWAATMSAQGASAIATVIIPVLALQELGVTSASMAVLSTAAACVALVAALPAGAFAEFRRKRPLMVAADAVRCASFVALTVAALAGVISFGWLIGALCVNAAMQMLFGSASMAHTKDLLPDDLRADAVGKLQSASWVAMIVGPVIAGLLLAVIPTAGLLGAIAACFAGSAVCLGLIRKPEASAPPRVTSGRRLRDPFAGVSYLARDPLLRPLLISWILFAGAVAALTPVTQVFFLKELHFSSAEYGVVMGVPSAAALAGAWLGGRVIRRFGTSRTIVIGSLVRIPLYLAYPLLPGGAGGLIGAITAFAGILFISSIVNAALTTLRMEVIPDELLSRTSSAWMMATMAAGPLLIPVAGVLMTAFSPRIALVGIAILVAMSAVILPRRRLATATLRMGQPPS